MNLDLVWENVQVKIGKSFDTQHNSLNNLSDKNFKEAIQNWLQERPINPNQEFLQW